MNENEKLTMEGLTWYLFQRNSEDLTLDDAICEFIDNSFDANAQNVSIDIENGDRLVIKDDGDGMSLNAMYNHAKNYISHTTQSGRPIGYFGVGSKNATMRICDQHIGATSTIMSCVTPGIYSRCTYVIDERKEDDFRHPQIIGNIHDASWAHSGTICVFDHIKHPNSLKDLEFRKILYEHIARTYGWLIDRGKTITLFGEKVEGDDKLHLSKLGDDINTDNSYAIGAYNYKVETLKLHKKTNPADTAIIKVVELVISRAHENECKENTHGFGGLSAIYRGRYIMYPLPNKPNIPPSWNYSERGGNGFKRVAIIVDGNEKVLGLKSHKNKGIDISESNEVLNEYIVEGYNDSFNHVIKKIFAHLETINKIDALRNDRKTKKRSEFKPFTKNELIAIEQHEITESKVRKENACATTVVAPIKVTDAEIIDAVQKDEQKRLERDFARPATTASEEVLHYLNETTPICINVHWNRKTRSAECEYNDNMPEMANKPLIEKLANILREESISQNKASIILSKLAFVMSE